ncbi:unnamed protein product [Psylliodes chrysocephalus]|uniref:beta-glucosidase n=1 Tax=Psylliodes chrysocephalus TaxID=3402493 RepID=A0A9P0D4M7_9CUCU|nr:unnamed protein product [Psylliodes chrysocephala]
MNEVGVVFYRFSLAWSRILPDGTLNNINQAGIDYYKNIFKELKAKGIRSFVTIYHWDIPTALQEKGGWLNPEVVDWYVAYAKLCFETFGEYVDNWITINEPKQICHAGYGLGVYAPGVVSNGIGEYVCARHVLLAHAKAWRLWDEKYRPIFHTETTIVLDSDWYEPATYSESDAIAAETKRQFIFGMYANPIIHGNWPKVMIDNIAEFSKKQGFNESRLPAFSNEEIELIKGTYDNLAINHYTTYMVKSIPEPTYEVSFDADSGVAIYQKDSWETAAIDWFKVVPWGMGKLLRWLKHTYGDQVFLISENGVSDRTGTLRDQHRIDYIKNYLSHLLDAIYDGGVNVKAYTLWSIIDNFEWTQGFNGKLGIYYVNQSDPSLPRIPKDSSKYYANVIKTKCLVDECV